MAKKKEDKKLEHIEEYFKTAKELLELHDKDIDKLKAEFKEINSKLRTVLSRMGL